MMPGMAWQKQYKETQVQICKPNKTAEREKADATSEGGSGSMRIVVTQLTFFFFFLNQKSKIKKKNN